MKSLIEMMNNSKCSLNEFINESAESIILNRDIKKYLSSSNNYDEKILDILKEIQSYIIDEVSSSDTKRKAFVRAFKAFFDTYSE